MENDFFRGDATAYRKALHEVLGDDGVTQDFGDGRQHWVAWFPTQIKSATGNTGEFNQQNADIRFSEARQKPFSRDGIDENKKAGYSLYKDQSDVERLNRSLTDHVTILPGGTRMSNGICLTALMQLPKQQAQRLARALLASQQPSQDSTSSTESISTESPTSISTPSSASSTSSATKSTTR